MNERIRALDGLRAIAILLVFTAHALFIVIGWVGVDLFFALSGFLITGVLRRDRTSPQFWRRFYTRRATRILPPLILAIVAASAFFHLPWHLLLLYSFFAGNVAESMHPGQAHSLGVLWSLAVEEHFYLLWPFAVRFLAKPTLIQLSCFLFIIEPIVRGVSTRYLHSFWPIYLLTPFRLDGLLLGSLLALLLETDAHVALIRQWSGPIFLAACSVYGCLSLLTAFDRSQNSPLFNSIGYSLIAIASTSLIAFLVLHASGVTSRVLSTRPLVFLGVVSYGFYLYHVLLIELLRDWATAHAIPHMRLLAPIAFVASLGLSTMSFYLYELPIVKWGKRLSPHGGRTSTTLDTLDAA